MNKTSEPRANFLSRFVRFIEEHLPWFLGLSIIFLSPVFVVVASLLARDEFSPSSDQRMMNEALQKYDEGLRDKARAQCEFVVNGALAAEEVLRQSEGSDRDPEIVASFTWQGRTHTVTKEGMKKLQREVNGCGAIYEFLGMENAMSFVGLLAVSP